MPGRWLCIVSAWQRQRRRLKQKLKQTQKQKQQRESKLQMRVQQGAVLHLLPAKQQVRRQGRSRSPLCATNGRPVQQLQVATALIVQHAPHHRVACVLSLAVLNLLPGQARRTQP